MVTKNVLKMYQHKQTFWALNYLSLCSSLMYSTMFCIIIPYILRIFDVVQEFKRILKEGSFNNKVLFLETDLGGVALVAWFWSVVQPSWSRGQVPKGCTTAHPFISFPLLRSATWMGESFFGTHIFENKLFFKFTFAKEEQMYKYKISAFCDFKLQSPKLFPHPPPGSHFNRTVGCHVRNMKLDNDDFVPCAAAADQMDFSTQALADSAPLLYRYFYFDIGNHLIQLTSLVRPEASLIIPD